MKKIKNVGALLMMCAILLCGAYAQPVRAQNVICPKSGCNGAGTQGNYMSVNCDYGHRLYRYTCSRCSTVFYRCTQGHSNRLLGL